MLIGNLLVLSSALADHFNYWRRCEFSRKSRT